MFRELYEIISEFLKRVVTSRLFILSIVFVFLYGVLLTRLFQLQIIEGEEAQKQYLQKTEKTLTTAGTRGNIYDRNGNVLAYNKLVYAVTIQDIGAYPKNSDRNRMLLQLTEILQKHGEVIEGKFEVAIDANGEMVYTTTSEAGRLRFLRDYYGLRSVDELDDEKGKYPSNITARELFDKEKQAAELDKLKDENGNLIELSDQTVIDIINIRYSLRLISYRKYESTEVATQVSEEAVADILEHSASLKGVNIEESTVRVYNHSIYLSHIVGYTGKVPEEQLEELQKLRPDYDLNDVVGRTGIEASMEEKLQGSKGHKTIYMDSMGRILETASETQALAGNDVYLTVDKDLQVGIYHILEQSLAGILVDRLVNMDVEITESSDASKLKIPIKDAYFQLINNNVLSLKEMERPDASGIEQQIYQKFLTSQAQILTNIRNELLSGHPTPMKALSEDMNAYMIYIYNYLSDSTVGIIKKEKIDQGSKAYQAWKNDEISLREYIYDGIANNWVDTTKLNIESKYSSADDTFQVLVDYTMQHLASDSNFTKKMYRYLINNNVITGRELCLALYEQGVLAYDGEEVQKLSTNGDNYAYTFLKKKISNVEITPAQLALDPSTASCVVTDVNTGEIRALVSYPGYDNNRMGDSTYFSQLQNDLSLPLYNNATQTMKAPGSTFKPITALAALEERVVGPNEKIRCTGIYEEVEPSIKCAIWPSAHGEVSMVEAIAQSCNYYFAEVAHRMSMDVSGNYIPDLGINLIREYATLFGLDRKSGVEVAEREPQMTDTDPERSSMGQGRHSYSSVQLSRYVTAMANRGNVYDLSLVDKILDSEGTLIKDYAPVISSQIEVPSSTWDIVQLGMRGVVSDGSARRIFQDLEIQVAGKTGTAQESRTRANHAFFISYAPFVNPEISVTVNIPFGYTSSNSVNIAKSVYRFYYGYTSFDQILGSGALNATDVKIGD